MSEIPGGADYDQIFELASRAMAPIIWRALARTGQKNPNGTLELRGIFNAYRGEDETLVQWLLLLESLINSELGVDIYPHEDGSEVVLLGAMTVDGLIQSVQETVLRKRVATERANIERRVLEIVGRTPEELYDKFLGIGVVGVLQAVELEATLEDNFAIEFGDDPVIGEDITPADIVNLIQSKLPK